MQGIALNLVGMSFYGDPFAKGAGWTEENEIGRLWKRFLAFEEANPDAIKHRTDCGATYEGHFETAETGDKGMYEVLVGLPCAKVEDVPWQCVAKVLPVLDYVVFTLVGDEIRSDWPTRIHTEHLPGLGFEPLLPFILERYDARFKGLDEISRSELEIYVPVKRTG